MRSPNGNARRSVLSINIPISIGSAVVPRYLECTAFLAIVLHQTRGRASDPGPPGSLNKGRVKSNEEQIMGSPRKRHSHEFKAKVALEAVKGVKTSSELAAEFGVHPVQIAQWKKHLQEGSPQLFLPGGKAVTDGRDALIEQLYQQVGQLQMEVTWLRKKGL